MNLDSEKVTTDDLVANRELFRFDRKRYFALAAAVVRQNPDDPDAYYERHWAWERVHRFDLALADIDKALALRDDYSCHLVRGRLLHRLRRYEEAIGALERAEALEPEEFVRDLGLLYRVDCHASLGDVDATLAGCARLPEGRFTERPHELLADTKDEVTAELRRLATSVWDAHRRRVSGEKLADDTVIEPATRKIGRRRKRETHAEFDARFKLRRSDPTTYLEQANEVVKRYPKDPSSYLDRHYGWEELGALGLALDDLDMAVSLDGHPIYRMFRGELLRRMRRYREAIEEYNRMAAMGAEVLRDFMCRLYRADCHASLGNVEEALADCAMLDEEHWTPGMDGTPAGHKSDVTAEIRQLATSIRDACLRRDSDRRS